MTCATIRAQAAATLCPHDCPGLAGEPLHGRCLRLTAVGERARAVAEASRGARSPLRSGRTCTMPAGAELGGRR